MKNNFEQLIKNSLENHEVTYEAGAWEKFNKAQPPTPLYKSKWFVGGAALIAIIAAVTLYNVEFNSTKTQVNLVNNPVTEVNKPIQLEKKTKTIQVKKTELEESKAEESITTESTINLNIEQEKSKSKVSLGKTEDKIKVEDKTNTDDKTLANLGDDKNGALKIPLGTEPKPIKPKVDLTTPSASFYLEKTICKGNNINLIADEANENYDYSWKLNDGEIISGKVVALEANLIGINKVTLFIKQGGLQIAEKKSTFTVLETPTGNVKIKLNQVALINELEFDMEYAYNQIVWSFGDGIKSTESSSTHTYKKAGKYTCEYTITGINGCSASFERNINIKGYYNLRTDYGFSPGKRDNLNDVFIPLELKELNVPFEMSIYARNGQLLYTSTSIDKPWDGRMKDGSTCTFGSYVWVVSLTNNLNEKEVYKGTITNVSN
tara:strand:- start:5426 stop:6730 length:1305 start_codon:yes stop_codon:yes gene_type:complete